MSEPRPVDPGGPAPDPDNHSPEPGERALAPSPRRLDRPPSSRFATAEAGPDGAPTDGVDLARRIWRRRAIAIVMSVVGAGAIVLLVGVLATTTGLLIVAGAIGLGVGSQLGARPAVALALAAVAAGDIGTWLYARAEGGVLGPVDYLLQVLGPAPLGQAAVATLAAWWASGRLRQAS